MAHLVAEGPEPGQGWCREFPAGQAVRIGRSPETGWDVGWDRQISRDHAELLFDNDRLAVRQFDAARNPIHFDGQPTQACQLHFGESFRIGKTVFRLVEEPPDQDGSGSVSPAGPGHPHRIGDYLISRLLGTGGMGSVYLARHAPTGRNVALKVLGDEMSINPDMVRRFQLEGECALDLKHANLVEVYETGNDDGTHYIAQEYIDGVDIGELIQQRGPLPPKRAISIIRQVAGALDYLHQENIVHRDIKPSNLLVSREGTPRLADMGVARSTTSDSDSGRITQVGTLIGTVDYIAPEQADDSHSADARSDIYSLGCTWYELLTGSPPFPNGTLTDKITAHATQPPPDPRELNPDVPEAMVAVLDRMMAKSPDRRYQSISELLDDIATDTVITPDVSNSVLAGLAESSGEFHLEDKGQDQPPASTGPLIITCANCGRSYKVRASLAGKRLKCRDCGKAIEAQAQ